MVPLVQQREQDKLLSEQQRSFDEAAVYLPEVATPGTAEANLFNEIWNATPELQRARTGPALVINAVAGILKDVPQGQLPAAPAPVAHKQAMTSPVPHAASPQRLDAIPGQADKDQGTLNEILDECRTQGTEVEDFAKIIGLKTGRAKSAD